MTEIENKNLLTPPPPPLSTAKQILLYTGLGAGIGAAIETGWQWASNNKQALSKDKIVEFAVQMGVISAIIGYFTSKDNIKMHNLSVENVKLQNKIGSLEAGQSDAAKSFVKLVTEPKVEQEHQQVR